MHEAFAGMRVFCNFSLFIWDLTDTSWEDSTGMTGSASGGAGPISFNLPLDGTQDAHPCSTWSPMFRSWHCLNRMERQGLLLSWGHSGNSPKVTQLVAKRLQFKHYGSYSMFNDLFFFFHCFIKYIDVNLFNPHK